MAKDLRFYWRYLGWLTHYNRAEHDVTIETENGVLTVSSKDLQIGKHLWTLREYEINTIRKSMTFLEDAGLLDGSKRKLIVDIGANVGMICIALLREKYFETAIAFEPGQRNFGLLEKNVGLNGLNNRVNCYQLALTSEDGEVEFEIARDNSGDNRVRTSVAAGQMGELDRETLRVNAITFDTFLRENNVELNDIGLIWIDVQGHEGHFFKGAKDFFRQRQIPVVSEFWPYGIARSGISKDEYCSTIANMFSKFYHFTETGFESRPASEIGQLFEIYNHHREVCSIILI